MSALAWGLCAGLLLCVGTVALALLITHVLVPAHGDEEDPS